MVEVKKEGVRASLSWKEAYKDTSMSNIEVISHNLAPVQYKELLEAVKSTLQRLIKDNKNYFYPGRTDIAFDIDRVADAVAKQFETSSKFPFEIRDGLSYATIHALDIHEKEDFSEQINGLRAELQKQLFSRMDAELKHHALDTYTNSLLTPLSQFARKQVAGLSYPLEKEYEIEKRRLHVGKDKPPDKSWLKAHKLTLRVSNITSFNEQVVESISSYLQQQEGCDDEDKEDVHEALEAEKLRPTSNLNQLQNIIVKESVARIHRDAKVRYLRYLFKGLQEWKKIARQKDEPGPEAQEVTKGISLLNNLIRRLQGLDAYIRQVDKDYGYYQVFFEKQESNYRDLFARADAFDTLPIIPEIEGFLGESTDQKRQSKTFVSGVKLKLNGAVHIHGGEGKPVFDYNVALLDPTSAAYKARLNGARSMRSFREKVLKVALLYCFIFVEMDNKDFRPGAYFEQELLPALRSNDAEQEIAALQRLKRTITTPDVLKNLETLRRVLKAFLTQANIGPELHEDTLVLSLDKSILVKDVNQMVGNNIFFQETFDSKNGRNALKYVAIKEANLDNEAISKLLLSLIFEPIYYHPTEDSPEKVSMSYEIQGIEVLPTFLAPVDGNATTKYSDVYADVYKNIHRIALYYRHRSNIHSDPSRAFVYRFTYTLLAYLFLKLLVDSVPVEKKDKVFYPLLCIHAEQQEPDEENEKYDDEAFMHSLSKLLSHMLAEDYASSSQGFYLDTVKDDRFKLGNALYSLYSALPHTFRSKENTSGASNGQGPATTTGIPPHALDKLAIIVVSSRKSDENRKSPDYYEATILGKVIGIERLVDGTIRLKTLSTFSANQTNKVLFSRPDVLIEQIKKCYKQSYKHFLYVAKAPYTSTLHISDTGNENLFFMNKDVIQAMREVDNSIKIYPAFCDKYYVINRQPKPNTLQADSLYIDSVSELTTVANDPSRRSQIFFNLFSGIKVNREAVYNGVMSYATLINVYDNDPTYDQYIWSDLLNTINPDNIKSDILDFITLLHFARYEKSSQLGFKLDPYTDIIGDKSVGTLAVFPNMNGKASFNALAFLTAVRSVLHANTK